MKKVIENVSWHQLQAQDKILSLGPYNGEFAVEREIPVELPTEPWTVIRAHWGADSEMVMTLDPHDGWVSRLGSLYNKAQMSVVSRFEVIAKPIDPDHFEAEDPISARVRRDTAKAVLNRVNEVLNLRIGQQDLMAQIAKEFGVES